MKFENYSIVKCPMGISIKPNNGDSDLELCLCVEGDNLVATLYETRNPIGNNHWCVPVGEIQHSIKLEAST
jgi:hypothetical protein